jgi:signal transduction histidine kinase
MMKIKRFYLTGTVIRNAFWNSLFIVGLYLLLNIFFLIILDYEAARIIDNHLDHELEHFRNTMHIENDSLIIDSPKELMETDLKVVSPTSFFLQVYTPAKNVLLESENLADFGAIPLFVPADLDTLTFANMTAHGRSLRIIYTCLFDEEGSPAAIMQLSTFKANLSQFMPVLFRYNLISFPFIGLLSIVGSILLARKSFAPVNKIIDLANSISATALTQRLDYEASPNDELGRLRDTLNSLFDRLELQFEKITQFTDNASHQLMSPLTVLKSELEYVLRKTHEQDEHRETFAIMSEQTERMIKIVRTLLILAKEDDDGRQEQTVFNLSKLLNGMQEVFIHNNLELKVENGLYVRGNGEYFAMAIQNIVDNAFKYSEPDAPVTISAALNDKKVIIMVCDTGVGIPADQRDRIFDRFYRFDSGVNSEGTGFGLGLSLAKAIVSSMNGIIEVHDNKPRGSCFIMSLEALSVE